MLLSILLLLTFQSSWSNPLMLWKKAPNQSEKEIGLPDNSTVADETPPFLLRIYDSLNNDNEEHFQDRSLQFLQSERDNDTGQFYVLPSRAAGPETAQKAEIYISTQALEDLPNNESSTVSIYETSSDIKVSSRPLSSQFTGWLSLPITKMMKRWSLQRHQPLRFRIFAERNDDTKSTRILHWNHPNPWLVIYWDTMNNHAAPAEATSKQHVRGSSPERIKRQIVPQISKSQKAVGCRKMDMIVNTTTLGWSGWLVRPKIFNAYQCKGKCSKSWPKDSINHVNLKALVHQKQGDTVVDEPCCVPTKLRAIPFIYRMENRGFVLRWFNDMVVEQCACY